MDCCRYCCQCHFRYRCRCCHKDMLCSLLSFSVSLRCSSLSASLRLRLLSSLSLSVALLLPLSLSRPSLLPLSLWQNRHRYCYHYRHMCHYITFGFENCFRNMYRYRHRYRFRYRFIHRSSLTLSLSLSLTLSLRQNSYGSAIVQLRGEKCTAVDVPLSDGVSKVSVITRCYDRGGSFRPTKILADLTPKYLFCKKNKWFVYLAATGFENRVALFEFARNE